MAQQIEVQAQSEATEEPSRTQEVFRFYELAKKQEWQVGDMAWGEVPPIPETSGPKEKQARRQGIWRSVITQQLQADSLAVEMAAQLLELARHHEAKLYYSTMAQDEARHVEAWLKLANEAGGVAERDPHLDELAKMTLNAETLEEKVFQMQVFFERLAYERVLLEGASKQTKDRLVKAANRLLPTFVDHALWRPKERAWIGTVMRETDIRRLQEDIGDGIRMASSLGLDVSDVEIPFTA